MIKFEVQETGRKDYPYNVQVWHSYDNGKSWYYAGHGEFCRTLEEVERYKRAAADGAERREKEIQGYRT